MATPADGPATPPVSLAQRAPSGPIVTRTWHAYLSIGTLFMDYKDLLEQKNRCIRSRLAHVSHEYRVSPRVPSTPGSVGPEVNHDVESTSFPYPKTFQRLLNTPAQTRHLEQRQIHDEERRIGRLDDNAVPGQNGMTPKEGTQPHGEDAPGEQGQAEVVKKEWVWGFWNDWFGITRTRSIEFETQDQPVYVVVGVFRRGDSNPQERVAFVSKSKRLFWELRWACFRLRGLTGTFLSLRHVKGFRLYKCDAKTGNHEHVDLDCNALSDLQLLLETYKSWFVASYIAQAWANWIHQTMNNESLDVLHGTYSLELVLDWSTTRISIVVILPVLLSLAIGIWLNASAWTDLSTIQTAWGTASYVVTAGGLVAALLGILSSIAEK